MFDPSKPVQTRDGRKARIICTDAVSDCGPYIVYMVEELGGNEAPITCTPEGHYYDNSEKSDLDLINIPEKHVRYINIDEDNLFGSRTEANKYSHTNRTACIRIEYEDGQFDE